MLTVKCKCGLKYKVQNNKLASTSSEGFPRRINCPNCSFSFSPSIQALMNELLAQNLNGCQFKLTSEDKDDVAAK